MASLPYWKRSLESIAAEEEHLMLEKDEYTPRLPLSTKKSSGLLAWMMTLAFAISLGANLYFSLGTLRTEEIAHQMFSPAMSAIEYVDVVTTSGFGSDKSPYMGKPTPETDALWSELYNFGVSRIPISDAAQLVNRTVPIANDPGYYVVSLDVFHELHCLNALRRRAWWDGKTDPDKPLMDMEHLDHCIEMIRENLMCSSDITPIPWVWDRTRKEALVQGKVIRTCRNFDAIRQWGIEHQVREFNASIHVEDPLGNIEIN